MNKFPTMKFSVLNFLTLLVIIASVACEFPEYHPQSQGKSRTARSGISPAELTSEYWRTAAQNKIRSQLLKTQNKNFAKNVIMFLGDGMSIPTLTAARIYNGQKTGASGEESSLAFDDFPYVGHSKTYCVDRQTADSACSATAYLCGVKANWFTIGLNAQVKQDDCAGSLNTLNHVSSIMSWAQRANKATGTVTTTTITHASPAGTYAHTPNRAWESDYEKTFSNGSAACSDIAKQLIRDDPGRKLNVIFGGGRSKLLASFITDEDGAKGQRLDSLDLVGEWLNDKTGKRAKYVYNRNSLINMDSKKFDYVLGLFAPQHLPFHLDRDATKHPSLKEMTVSAIEVLKNNPNGFVLFVEGGRIDHGHHASMATQALEETVQLSEAIKAAIEITSESDTLIVVTSDHSHTMSISGYADRGNDIIGLNTVISDIDKMPYATLSYANGPNAGKPRYMMTSAELKNKNYLFPATVPLSMETHGGDDVGIFARGPYAHLFAGTLEQNTIPHIMAFAACIGDGITACNPSG